MALLNDIKTLSRSNHSLYTNLLYHTDTRLIQLLRATLSIISHGHGQLSNIPAKKYQRVKILEMKLLDLPLELVRSIIETTVQDVGLRSSARLREVCSTSDCSKEPPQ